MGKRSAIDRAIDGVEDASMMLSKSRALAIRVLKAAKKDKARLDWLLNHNRICLDDGIHLKETRQAIDKAMRSEK